MTNQEIKNYFGRDAVYMFNGSLNELNSLMIDNNISYNYIVAQYQIYFIAHGDFTDERAVLLGE